jgi:hypothetical protein
MSFCRSRVDVRPDVFPVRLIQLSPIVWQGFHVMRMTLIARSHSGADPNSLTMRPSHGAPGDYSYATELSSLLRLLRKEAELPLTVLDRFQRELATEKTARLASVEMNERVLTDIWYFVD